MKRFTIAAKLIVFCVTAMRQVSAAPAHPDTAPTMKTEVDLRQHPTGGKSPVEVSVGLYVSNLIAIDESRESFEVSGYLIGEWRDPRLGLSDPTSGDNGPH